MKKILLLLLLPSISVFAQDSKILSTQLQTLIPLYEEYIKTLQDPKSKTAILETNILKKPITISNVRFINTNYQFSVFPLDLFNSINNLSTMTRVDKSFIADMDLAKLKAATFMLSNLDSLQTHYLPKRKKAFFKNLYKNGELQLLSLAKKALHETEQNAEVLDTEYNLIINYLSMIPFPAKYSFYRRRMRFTIAYPQAAQQEIDRIHQQLIKIE